MAIKQASPLVTDPGDAGVTTFSVSPEPSFAQSIYDNFSVETGIGLAQGAGGVHHRPDPGFNPWSHYPDLKNQSMDMMITLGSSRSLDEFNQRLHQKSVLDEKRQRIHEDGLRGLALSFGVGTALDPATYVGLGAVKAGARAIDTGVKVGQRLATANLVTEMALHSEPGREPWIAAMAPAVAGVIGLGVGALSHKSTGAVLGETLGEAGVRSKADRLAAGNQSVGARGSGVATNAAEALDDMTPVGAFGLEKSPIHLGNRLLNYSSLAVRDMAERLLDYPGLLKKEANGIAPRIASVETTKEVNWTYKLSQAIGNLDRSYLRYRMVDADTPIASTARLLWNDLTKGRAGSMSPDEFRSEVYRAMYSKDSHAIPEVAEAAVKLRPHFDEIGAAANDARLFTYKMRKVAEGLAEEIQLKRDHNGVLLNPDRLKAKVNQLQDLERQITGIEGGGWKQAMGDESFAPKFLRRDKVMADLPKFRGIVSDFFFGKGLSGAKLTAAVDAQVERMLNKPSFRDIHDWRSAAASANDRTWDIPSALIHDFLETDIEQVFRHYNRTMTADIELARAFPADDFDLSKSLKAIKDEYMGRISAESVPAKAEALAKEMNDALRDLAASRDLLRGTYGIPTDPDAMHWRALKSGRTLNYLTMMGGAAINVIADTVRPIMVEGLGGVYKYGIKPMFDGMEAIKLAGKESQFAGTALEMVTHTHMNVLLERGAGMGRASAIEAGIDKASVAFSTLNLLDSWTSTVKMWSGTMIGSRILDLTHDLAQNGVVTNEKALLRGGIGHAEAISIADQFGKHGDIIIGKLRMSDDLALATDRAGVVNRWMDRARAEGGVIIANTEKWDNPVATSSFRNALYADVNRTIVTPSLGDKPLFLSTELGRSLGQFKGFSLASTQRILMAGLQENDAKFWAGAASLAGAGMLVDFLKTEVQYRKDWNKKSTYEKIVGAIDRGGMLGIFMDANSTLEKLTNNQLGLHGIFDGGYKRTMDSTKAGAVLGPTAANAVNLWSVASDVATGKADAWTAARMKSLIPGAGLFYLQPAAEMLNLP